jgi:hypothetical protein
MAKPWALGETFSVQDSRFLKASTKHEGCEKMACMIEKYDSIVVESGDIVSVSAAGRSNAL